MVRRVTAGVLVFVAVVSAALHAQSAGDTAATARVRFEGLGHEVYLVVDGRYDRARIIGPDDTVSVPGGVRSLRLYDRDSVSVWEDMPIEAGSVVTLRVRYRMPSGPGPSSPFARMYWRANVLMLTDSASDVYIDGRYVGSEIAWLDTLPGEYTVRTFDPLTGRTHMERFTAGDRLTTLRLYTKPERWVANALAIVPGARQIYRGDAFKGWLLLGASGYVWGAAVEHHRRYGEASARYEEAKWMYSRAATEAEALALGDEAGRLRDVAAASRDRRTRAIAAGLALIVVHVADMLLASDLEARVEIPLDPYDIPPGALKPDDVRVQMRWRIPGR